MKDKTFLMFIHDRLRYVHEEDVNTDYMIKLRNIIVNTPEDRDTKIQVHSMKQYELLTE